MKIMFITAFVFSKDDNYIVTLLSICFLDYINGQIRNSKHRFKEQMLRVISHNNCKPFVSHAVCPEI